MKLYSRGIYYHAEIFQNKPERPWLMMLHGFMGSGRAFDHLLDPLKEFCNPVTVDLAGHGQTGGSLDPERYNTDNQIADLVSILGRLRLAPVVLYGYSMGGRLALQFALSHSDMIDGLILESATAGIDGEEQRSKRRNEDHRRAEKIESGYENFLTHWVQKSLFTGFTGADPDEVLQKKYRETMASQNPGYVAACLKGFGTGSMEPVWDRLESLAAPVLLIAGEMDEKFVTLNRSMHDKLPRSTFEVIDEAAHRVHLDHPEALTEKIEIFIKNKLQKA